MKPALTTRSGPDAAADEQNGSSGIHPDTAQQATSIENDSPPSYARVSGEPETTITARQPTNLDQNASDLADLRHSDPNSHEEPQGLREEPEPAEVTTEEVEAAVQNSLREWVHNALMTDRRSLQHHHYRRTARLATIMGGSAHLRDALVALDDADWNLGTAIQQYHFDNAARQQAAQSQPVDAPDSNRGLDRSAASGGPHWKANKHKLTSIVKVGKRWRRRNFEDVHEMTNEKEGDDNKAVSNKKAFNIDSPTPQDLLRLNKWRNSEIMKKTGPPRRPRGQYSGDWWHPAAKRDVMRRFIRNVKSGKLPDYKGIGEAHNKLFEGVFLPREIHEAPVRNYDQVAALSERAWRTIGRASRTTKGAKKRETVSKIFEKLLNEEKARAKKNINGDFSATEEEVKEIEDEDETLQDDTATEEGDSDDGSDQDPLDSDDVEQAEDEQEGEGEGEGDEGEEESSGEVLDVPYQGDGHWDDETDSDFFDY